MGLFCDTLCYSPRVAITLPYITLPYITLPYITLPYITLHHPALLQTQYISLADDFLLCNESTRVLRFQRLKYYFPSSVIFASIN